MRRCLELAARGLGNTQSNPMVGCVIVLNDAIIGEGYHEKYGEAHAEVNAFAQLDPALDISQATVYVSLEPCAHFGKTPPCCDLIIQKQVKRAVIAMKDPFPKVDGEGIKRMQTAGIEVEVGLLEEEARALNKRFLTYHLKKRPYIILKWMQSSDGIIGRKGVQVPISNQLSSKLVHRWRAEEQAILIGPETAINDNPSLTTRKYPGKNPIRILLDRNLRVPTSLKLFTDEEALWVFNASKAGTEGKIQYFQIAEEDFISSSLKKLHELGICSVLVEGGTSIHNAFLDAGLWDQVRLGVAEMELKEGVTAPNWPGVTQLSEKVGTDEWFYFFKPA